MASWNYRVIRSVEGGEPVYKIHEVYYDDNGHIEAWTEEPVLPYGEDLHELREDIHYFLQAFRQPVLEVSQKNGKEELIEVQDEYSLNRGHYFEFLDRAFVALEYSHQFLGSHPVLRREERLREIYQQVESLLAELYQEAGWLEFERDDPNSG